MRKWLSYEYLAKSSFKFPKFNVIFAFLYLINYHFFLYSYLKLKKKQNYLKLDLNKILLV